MAVPETSTTSVIVAAAPSDVGDLDFTFEDDGVAGKPGAKDAAGQNLSPAFPISQIGPSVPSDQPSVRSVSQTQPGRFPRS